MFNTKERVLNLVRDGKVSVDEGLRLLEALDNPPQNVSTFDSDSNGKKGRILRTRVLDTAGNAKVNLNVPLALAKVAMKFIPKDVSRQLEEEGINLDELLSEIKQINSGKIIDIDSEDAKVEISVQ